jgi:hypothetical protein
MADQLIALSWNTDAYPTRLEADDAVRTLMSRYRALPRHIARKHLGAAMRRLLKRGVPILRRNTPPLGVRRGRRRRGERARSTGNLRRAVTVRTGQTGGNTDFNSFVWGCLGYKAGPESRKAIWLQYGTRRGIQPVLMIERTMQEFGPIAAADLASELASALEKSAKEVSSGKNPLRDF